MAILSMLSGLGLRKRSRKPRRIGLSCPSLSLRERGLGFFQCQTGGKGINSRESKRHQLLNHWASSHHIPNHLRFLPTVPSKSMIKKRKSKIKKGRKRSKKNKKVQTISGFGFLGGYKKMARRKKKTSLGSRLARRFGVSRGKCKKAGKRRVCKTRRGKGYIRKDKVGKKHNSTGRFALRGLGLGSFGAFRGDSCAHKFARSRVGHGTRIHYTSRRRGKGRSRGLRGFGLGAISVPSSVKSFLPPITKDSLMNGVYGFSGAVVPTMMQNFLPGKWRVGWRGILTYTLMGGAYIGVSRKVGALSGRSNVIAMGWMIGLVMKVSQDYIFKRSILPVQSTKAVPALKGLDACSSCANVEDCSGLDDCLGYVDEDLDGVDEDLDGVDEDLDGVDEDLDGVGDYLTLDGDDDD